MKRLLLPCLVLLIAGCTVDCPTDSPEDVTVITATASLPGCRTKMIYEDHCSDGNGVKAGWQTGDTFLAYEINGTTVTPVTFTATAPADVKTSFKSSGAVPADAGTRWIAVLGKGASFDGEKIRCTYTSQNGSLDGLEGVDYMTASASGANPDFDYANGSHLSYLMRIAVPEGVGAVEFNTCAEGAEWTVGCDGTISSQKADYRPSAVKSFRTKAATKAGEFIYLSVPAIDYSESGLIVTVMSADGTRSQGKVTSTDFSGKGGFMGRYDIGSELIDRPSKTDAIDFITASNVSIEHLNNTSYEGLNDSYRFTADAKWAPFNLGAKAKPAVAEDTYGSLFAWGETEQKDEYSWDNYKRSSDHAFIGYKRTHVGSKDITLELSTISGTKYDVARVKWGKDWRMPFLEDMLSLLGTNETINTSSGQRIVTTDAMVTTDEQSFGGVTVSGRSFTRNGRTLFLPFAGRYYYTEGNKTSTKSYVDKAGCYYCGTHNVSSGSKEAYRLFVRANQLDCNSQEAGYAFSIRPVLALDSDYDPIPVKISGKVTDASTGRGIAGVAVSDGFSYCRTSSDGSYTIDADVRSRNICITVPASYEIPLGTDGRPAFYKLVKAATYDGGSVDFALTPRKTVSDRFTLITVSDAHVKTESQLSRFRSESAPDIQATIDELEAEGNAGPIIGIALGDMLTDNMDMADPVVGVYTGFSTAEGRMPFFYVIGNHDHQSMVGKTDEAATEYFLNHFGPRDYSFDIGNAHVIVMDGIDYSGVDEGEKIKYGERITGEQLHWLKEDIANVENKSGKVGIFCVHAPVYNGLGNLDAIKSLMREFSESHVYSGHIHNMANKFFKGFTCKGGRTLVEHNMQALSGMVWDADLSPNGTPAGYGIFTFEGTKLSREYNKVTGESKDFQIRVYDGNDDYGPDTPNSGFSKPKKNTVYGWDSKFRGKFLVRVWDGEDVDVDAGEATWTVTFEKDGVSIPMTHLDGMVDNCAIAYIVDFLGSPHGCKDSGGGATSIGWWAVDAPGGDPSAVTGWKVVAEHTLPGGWSRTYTSTTLSKDYQGYYSGTRFKY